MHCTYQPELLPHAWSWSTQADENLTGSCNSCHTGENTSWKRDPETWIEQRATALPQNLSARLQDSSNLPCCKHFLLFQAPAALPSPLWAKPALFHKPDVCMQADGHHHGNRSKPEVPEASLCCPSSSHFLPVVGSWAWSRRRHCRGMEPPSCLHSALSAHPALQE